MIGTRSHQGILVLSWMAVDCMCVYYMWVLVLYNQISLNFTPQIFVISLYVNLTSGIKSLQVNSLRKIFRLHNTRENLLSMQKIVFLSWSHLFDLWIFYDMYLWNLTENNFLFCGYILKSYSKSPKHIYWFLRQH